MRPAALLLALFTIPSLAQDFDLLILGGRVVDGSGNPWFRADVGVRGGRIAAIGPLANRSARRTLNAQGLIIAPGFVDMMGATSEPLLADRTAALSKLRQGITTI